MLFSNPTRRLVLGGPGCGKTTQLLNMVEERIASGTPPGRIAFVSFTNKAADEAAERAMTRFGLRRNELPHFRTVHSMAYRGVHITRNQVMQRQDYRALGDLLGVRFSGGYDLADGVGSGGGDGDQMLSLVDYARATGQPLRDTWEAADTDVDWFALLRFNKTLDAYKMDGNRVDFGDMLSMYASNGDPLDVDVAIVDEAQDLSQAQWAVVARAFANAPELIVAGDDDQAIHEWNGAQVSQFLAFDGERVELPLSYRLSREVHDVGRSIALRIKQRIVKTWDPASHPGRVSVVSSLDTLDLSKGTWMLLARNKVFLTAVEDTVAAQGYLYSTAYGPSASTAHVQGIYAWERLRAGGSVTGVEATSALKALGGSVAGATAPVVTRQDLPANLPWDVPWFEALQYIPLRRREYYRAALRRGERLAGAPRIYIGTVHSVKGGEADHVALLLDMTARTYHHYQRFPDQEHRVFYVGATRARHSLAIVQAQGEFGYEL